MDAHPSDRTLSSYGQGRLDGRSAEALVRHLRGCPDCRSRVAVMSADSVAARKPSGASTIGRPQTPGAGDDRRRGSPAGTLPPGLADHPDYEIRKELGRGGMGVVYLAHNRLLGRDEVLKVMGRQVMERPEALDRFLREIRAVARLQHPNIVTAYSATRLGESLVFAMEYVEGLDLARLVKAKGPLPVALACNFAHQAALGLQHAHEEGLVHRDIKPGNLMLSRQGERPVVKKKSGVSSAFLGAYALPLRYSQGMGRPLRPRPDPEGATTFHVLNRGNNRADVFVDDDDRQAFLDAIARAKVRYPFRLLGYCLMTNHFHLAVRPEPGQSISKIVQSITVAHTWRYHRRHRSSGHVWQGRFKSPAVQDGDQILTLLRYIEANPLRAGMVAKPKDYPWSSHAARVTGRGGTFLDDFPEWAELGTNERSRRAAWRRRVARPLGDEELRRVRHSVATGHPLGTDEWSAATSAKLGCAPPVPKRRGRPLKVHKVKGQ